MQVTRSCGVGPPLHGIHANVCPGALHPPPRYNLLREDSEGYAKLITCLNSCGEGALNEEAVELMFQEVQVRTTWGGDVSKGGGVG